MVTLSTLDPRTPLVLDTHELGRRPGAMQQIQRSVRAPADLGIGGVVGVPEGADIELDLRLEAVMEGVLVSGSARAPLFGECVRCLDVIDSEMTVEFQELYVYPDRAEEMGAEADDDVYVVEGELIDLEPTLRDAVVLALPQAPLCRDDCPGLCPQCGVRLADDPTHQHESTDPRWAALAKLRIEGDDVSGPESKQGAGPTEES
ncbi:MAG TPA: YceD family protein [Jiangellaceae bacterium]|nr:YceD family protein [Jiangellaceae bacterium]